MPPQIGAESSEESSGLRMAIVVPQLLKVDFVAWTTTTCPLLPVNVRRAFCPGVVIFTVTGTPSDVIVSFAFATRVETAFVPVFVGVVTRAAGALAMF